jgi:hypothetical protein
MLDSLSGPVHFRFSQLSHDVPDTLNSEEI